MEKGKKSLERLMTEFDDVVDLALDIKGHLSLAGRPLPEGVVDKEHLGKSLADSVEQIIERHRTSEIEKLTPADVLALRKRFVEAMSRISQPCRQDILIKLEQIGVEQTPIDLSFLKS